MVNMVNTVNTANMVKTHRTRHVTLPWAHVAMWSYDHVTMTHVVMCNVSCWHVAV